MLVLGVEHVEEGEAQVGYRLHLHGRRSHTASHGESLLQEAGFHSLILERETLWLEVCNPVSGLLVTARTQ